MNKRSRKSRYNRCRHLNDKKCREYHHNHTKSRTNTRFGLVLTNDDLEEIIGLIRKKRNETVKFVRRGRKKKDDANVYIVIFRNKALPLVYNPKENWLVTCLRMKWALRGLPKERIEYLKEWLRERRIDQEKEED